MTAISPDVSSSDSILENPEPFDHDFDRTAGFPGFIPLIPEIYRAHKRQSQSLTYPHSPEQLKQNMAWMFPECRAKDADFTKVDRELHRTIVRI